jgi:hypothetical protein
VLNLLQPLNRMPGLYRGQRWQMPLIDPLVAAGTGPRPATLRLVEAEVEEATLVRSLREVPCWMVVYSAHGEVLGRSWVRQLDAVVLQQEVLLAVAVGPLKPGDRLLLTRESEN